jgi:hypothetical protein
MSQLEEKQQLTAEQVHQAADQVVFGDLVGCALSSGEPVWSLKPKAHWCVVTMIEVDAKTLAVSLSTKERVALLKKVAAWAIQTNLSQDS